jgi:hypothetical protein
MVNYFYENPLKLVLGITFFILKVKFFLIFIQNIVKRKALSGLCFFIDKFSLYVELI